MNQFVKEMQVDDNVYDIYITMLSKHIHQNLDRVMEARWIMINLPEVKKIYQSMVRLDDYSTDGR